ncbi:MAG: DJ-1/PfpI family protein [Candidatus ainarchaeum sp.]|nr:DJ-1/PfpI family protein [Candidatus ainarchaeum sp.]MDD5095913.1 DJ-1/PfpI family protein [Candidatus ainarchaeum sp.]
MAEKGIAIVIPPEGFRDEEFTIPCAHFASKGIKTTVASMRRGACRGSAGTPVDASISLAEVKAEDFDAVFFVGGPGTPVVRASNESMRIAREFAAAGKPVSAICWAPTILAKAGVLEGRKATVWLGHDPEYGMDTGKVLGKFGASYTGEAVTVDGAFITADGPRSAKMLSEEVEKRLS